MVTASRTALSVRSVDEVVNLTDEPKLFKLQKNGGQMNTALIIEVMLSKMVDDMHLKDGLTEANIDEIVRRLTTDDDVRYWLTLADISFLCRRIAEGYYGKTYGRFGLGEFNECLVAYCNERRDCHQRQNISEAKKTEQISAKELEKEVGYHIEGGRLVPNSTEPQKKEPQKKEPQKKKPIRYIYDDKGNIRSENPVFWGKVRGEKSREEMEKINRQNKVMELVHELMKADPSIGYINAVEMAAAEIEKGEAQ